MKSFFKEFLRDDLGDGSERKIFLGAFGKHPGWDDHLDDIGLETESLVACKKVLYVDGIGQQLNSGAWEKLPPESLIPFGHYLVWHRAPQMLIGKLWASRDGKGRALYPMVVCAHCTGLTLAQVIETMLPCLDQIEAAVVATNKADEVRSIIAQVREELGGWVAEIGEQWLRLDAEAFAEKIDDRAAPREVVVKSLAEVCRCAREFKSRAGNPAMTFRLPAASSLAAQDLLFWKRALGTQFDPAAPILLLMPQSGTWVDGIVGEPSSADFFGLRASLQATPLTPGSDDAVSRESAAGTVEALFNPATEDTDQKAEPRRAWFSRLFQQ